MHLIPNPRAYQALDGAFTLQDGEKVKSELRIPLVRTTTREARIIVTRNPALQKEAYTLNVTPGEGAHHCRYAYRCLLCAAIPAYFGGL